MKTIKYLYIFIFLLILIIFSTSIIIPQNNELPQGIPSVPGKDIIGEINPETGQPNNLESLQKYGDYFVNREQNKSFLLKEWTNLLANNKFFGPILFYTDSFFSLLDPLWQLIFQIKFSWSWFFILSLGAWIAFIIIFYILINSFTDANKIIILIVSIIIASLIGISEGINKGINLLIGMFPNFWILLIGIIIAILILLLYVILMKKLGKNLKDKGHKEKENLRELKQETLEKITDINLRKEGL